MEICRLKFKKINKSGISKTIEKLKIMTYIIVDEYTHHAHDYKSVQLF